MNRLISIDIAKAICIILVVIGHYNPDNAPEWYHTISLFIYTFHMPLFMFASGYVYAATIGNLRGGEFLYKKFKRLMIPYFSTSIIIISIKLLTQQRMLVENPVTYLSYFKMFYLPEAGFFLWFIWALWLIFLLVAAVRSKAGQVVLFAISLCVTFLPIEWPEIFCINFAIRMLKYFMLGIILNEYPRWTEIGKKVPGIIPVCALPALFIFNRVTQNTILTTILDYILPFIGIYAICVLSRGIKHWNYATQKLLVISASSYIIYLFHTTFEGLVKSLIHKVPTLANGNNSLYFTIGAALIVGAGVILPIVLHRRILSQNRVLRFLFGLKPVKQPAKSLR